MIARHLYSLAYRSSLAPWDMGPRPELVDLVRTGQLPPGRAVDLGCGTGSNAVFLAEHGFEVTGIDFAPAAITRATRRAARAGVTVRFVEDDLTALRHDVGTFDLLVDYGTLDDLSAARRDRYLHNVLPLAAPGALFLLWTFEWSPRAWERRLGVGPLAPGEVDRRFGAAYTVERIAASPVVRRWRLIPGFAAYLMHRRSSAVVG